MQPKIFDNGFVPPGARAPFIPDREIQEWRVSDKILKLKNGSIVGFKSAEAGPSAYQGAQKDIIHFDEEHAHNIYNEACIRIGAGRRLRVYGTATLLPGQGETGGVTWVYSEILKPFLDGKRTDVGCFGASMYDNPYLLPQDIAVAESHYPPESVEGRIRIGGEWLPGLSGARAYPSFDAKIHVRPQPEPRPRIPLCLGSTKSSGWTRATWEKCAICLKTIIRGTPGSCGFTAMLPEKTELPRRALVITGPYRTICARIHLHCG
jgi:phage terminase large subunit-like protein